MENRPPSRGGPFFRQINEKTLYRLIRAFGERFSKTRRLDPKYHRYLIDAFDERQTADYDTSADVTRDLVLKIIGWGEEFLEAARKFLLITSSHAMSPVVRNAASR